MNDVSIDIWGYIRDNFLKFSNVTGNQFMIAIGFALVFGVVCLTRSIVKNGFRKKIFFLSILCALVHFFIAIHLFSVFKDYPHVSLGLILGYSVLYSILLFIPSRTFGEWIQVLKDFAFSFLFFFLADIICCLILGLAA